MVEGEAEEMKADGAQPLAECPAAGRDLLVGETGAQGRRATARPAFVARVAGSETSRQAAALDTPEQALASGAVTGRGDRAPGAIKSRAPAWLASRVLASRAWRSRDPVLARALRIGSSHGETLAA